MQLRPRWFARHPGVHRDGATIPARVPTAGDTTGTVRLIPDEPLPATVTVPPPAWAVPQPYHAPVTGTAVMARSVTRFAEVCSIPCQRQGCTRTTARMGTRSFTALYAAAQEDGWRQDGWGRWMCPQRLQKPGYWPLHAPAYAPAAAGAEAEVALVLAVKAAAGDLDDLRDAIGRATVKASAAPAGKALAERARARRAS